MQKIVRFTLQQNEEYIPLIQLLKVVGVVRSGGEAQLLVESGEVRLNGETELRKRAKLRKGDIVSVENWEIAIVQPEN